LKYKKQQLDYFFYWINERHSIYLNKDQKKPWPWTRDPILQQYKFTNPFRQNDRVTRELTKRIKPHLKEKDMGLLFFNIALFRMYNWPPTYDVLGGWHKSWDERKAKKILHAEKKEGKQIFTGAYIITNAGSTRSKVDTVTEAMTHLWKDRNKIVKEIGQNSKLETACNILQRYPLIGKFIAYELVTDLRHTPILNKAGDIMTWANPGPGAQRGIHRLLTGKKDKVLKLDYVQEMRYLLQESKKYGVLKKHVPKLEMRDIEHSLCEFDKYMRVKNGEGRPRSIYRRPE